MEQFAFQYGYFGVITISFIGSLSIIFPIPSTIIIYLLGSVLNPFLIALAGGLGSGLGEITGYFLGYYGRALIKKERQRKMDFMLKLFTHYGPIIIFLFALTPLPDDLLIIPLGIMRYNFLKFFIPCVLGKILMCFIIAIGGNFSLNFIKYMIGEEGGWWTMSIATILLGVIILIMIKVDWEKIFNKYVQKSFS